MCAPSVIFVCTGNICRSPAAELLASHHFAGSSIVFSSAGTRAPVGAGISAEMGALLRAEGIESDGFAARRLTPRLVSDVDLVLGMTAEHRGAAAQQNPRLVGSCFTLPEFSRIVEQIDSAGEIVGLTPADRFRSILARASFHRHPQAAAREIDDPYGGPAEAYGTAYAEISSAIRAVAARVMP